MVRPSRTHTQGAWRRCKKRQSAAERPVRAQAQAACVRGGRSVWGCSVRTCRAEVPHESSTAHAAARIAGGAMAPCTGSGGGAREHAAWCLRKLRCWGRAHNQQPAGRAALLRRGGRAAAAGRCSARRVRVPKATRSGGARKVGPGTPYTARGVPQGPTRRTPPRRPHRLRPRSAPGAAPRRAPSQSTARDRGRPCRAGSGVRLRRQLGDDVARHAPAVPAPREPAHQAPLPRLRGAPG